MLTTFSTIRAKLTSIFGLIVCLTAVISLMSIFLFNSTRGATRTIISVNIPDVVNTNRLSVAAYGVAAAMPSLAVSETVAQLNLANQETGNLLKQLEELILSFTKHPSAIASLESTSIQSIVKDFEPLLEEIYSSRLEIITLGNKLADRLATASQLSATLMDALEPIITSAGFNLSLTLMEMIGTKDSEAEVWRKQAFELDLPNFQYGMELGLSIQRINSQLLLSAGAATTVELAAHQKMFARHREALTEGLKLIGYKGTENSLISPSEELLAIGQGREDIFKLRARQLSVMENIQRKIKQAHRIASDLTVAADHFSSAVIDSARDTAARIHRSTRTGTWIIVAIALTTMAMSLTFSYRIVVRDIVQRITNLQTKMVEGQQGNLSLDIDTRGLDEIADMSKSFSFFLKRVRSDVAIREENEKRIREAMHRAESANEAKSRFLAHMSHELRTPLNAILGFSKILHRKRSLPADEREYLEIINRSGDHLLGMINNVLDLSKIEAGRFEAQLSAFDLPQMLKDIHFMFEARIRKAGLVFNMELHPSIPRFIETDIVKMRQILINLLGNAVKYTKEGGVSLDARAEMIEGRSDLVGLWLEVKDSGIGIPPEHLERILTPFVQVAQNHNAVNSTGLGLAISKSFVDLLGGEINITSTPGKGSTFKVYLPVSLAPAVDAQDAAIPRQAVSGLASDQPVWRILVAEDNGTNRLLLNHLLTEVGFEVKEAENGQEAVDIYQQWDPDLICMDMHMPVLDGAEATAIIRSLPGGGAVKIVAITASAFKEESESILKAGCDDVVLKPYHDHEIFDTMVKQLGVRYTYQ